MKNMLNGKVSIVTGAGTGIGEGIATVFGEQGSKVVVSDFNEEAGKRVTQKLQELGVDTTYIYCDVAVAEEVQSLVNQTVEIYGHLDVMVNNAGYLSTGNIIDTPNEEWDKGIAVDLTGVFYGCKYAVEAMLKNEGTHKGSIINVSSLSGLFGDYSFTWYNAAKGGVSNFRALDLL
jgi:NAD(P)-dependent dehydrogenase (short-subunit alcohol dehydrogenase family)